MKIQENENKNKKSMRKVTINRGSDEISKLRILN